MAAGADVILSALPSVDALDVAFFGPHGIAAGAHPGLAVLEMSTFPLDAKERARVGLLEHGVTMLDCPVSGTGAQAAVKDIVVYASGDADAIAKVRPMFAGFSRATYNTGAFGNGSRMKYVANLLVTIHNVASAEAMVLGIKSGLDPQMVYDLIRAGVGTSRVFEVRGPMMVADDYEKASMSVKLYHKDIDVIADHAAKLGVPVPLFSASIPVYSAALSMGYGEQDTASVCGVLETMAGVKREKQSTQGG